MRTISDTIARLAALKAMHAGGSRTAAGEALPELSGFGSNPGALVARYRLPAAPRETMPLVVVLHGCTQDAAGYDHHSGWSQLADEAGFALLYPEQQRANNPNLCFNWFLPGDTRRQAGEALSIRQMIDVMVSAHAIDASRIYVTGLSAGGAMAATMLATHPEIFAGGAVIAGLAHGIARTVPEAFDRMRGHGIPAEGELQRRLRAASRHRGAWPRIAIWQGDADRTVAPENAEAIAAQWRGVHGLDASPDLSAEDGRLSRRVWRDAQGDPVMELTLVAGMGHGTPVGAGLGAPGPHMLDVGVSSTRAIAAFWGIAGATPAARSGATAASSDERARPRQDAAPRPAQDAQPDARPAASATGASGIQKTIEDALRAAGLMR